MISEGKRPLMPAQAISKVVTGAVAVLAATEGDGTSGPASGGPNGLFTYHLLQGMRGSADRDADGAVTLAELASYTRTRVIDEAKLSGNTQVPTAQLGASKDVVVVEAPRADVPLGAAPFVAVLAPRVEPSGAVGTTQAAGEDNERHRRQCEGGVLTACTILGFNYATADGLPKVLAKANQFYEKACDGGEPTACRNLGLNYQDGVGLLKQQAKANELFAKSCDAGKMTACNTLGLSYERGAGFPRISARPTSSSEGPAKVASRAPASTWGSTSLLAPARRGIWRKQTRYTERPATAAICLPATASPRASRAARGAPTTSRAPSSSSGAPAREASPWLVMGWPANRSPLGPLALPTGSRPGPPTHSKDGIADCSRGGPGVQTRLQVPLSSRCGS